MLTVIVFVAWPALVSPAWAAAPPGLSAREGKPAAVFGPTRVWRMHLIIAAGDWQKMQPSKGAGMGKPAAGQPRPSADRKARGGFGFDFEYVKADLVINGTRLRDVGIRFKGNSSYAQASHGLKRPFRIGFDRHVAGQTFKGLRKVSLNNHVMDPTTARETLSFAIYRAAGVPAPRTAYVELTLTVPGKHEKELLGLYTLVEAIDKRFLEEHFGSAKGLLLKPEQIGPLDYLGESWSAYESRYRPKTRAGEKARRRLIEFAWLANQSSDERFHKEIARHLDIDSFLRYLATTVALSSLDSFMGLGHNYYLYLSPKKDRFVFLPWDLDHSFAGLTFPGIATTASLVDLSIRRPQLGSNRLVERLLADPKWFVVYRGHLQRLLKTAFIPAKIASDLAAIHRATASIRQRERRAAGLRGETRWSVLALLLVTPSSDLAGFVRRRSASIEAQLAGKAKGTEPNIAFIPLGEQPWMALARPILASAHKGGTGKLTRAEAEAGARALFRACDRAGKKSLDRRALATGLGRLDLPSTRGKSKRNFAFALAGALIAKAGKEGKVSEQSLADAAVRLFDRADRDRSGALDERKLVGALLELLPPPKVPFDPRAEARPDPTKKKEKR